MYTCGPTVYDFAHIGNFRAFLTYDLLKRILTYFGYEVYHVCNITDIDDKIIARAKKQKSNHLNDISRFYEDRFFEDLRALNIIPADKYPRATEHIDDMLAMIQGLAEKGLAYETEDGSWYFDTIKQEGYGRNLVRMDWDNDDANGKPNGTAKRNKQDFCLWKSYMASFDREDSVWEIPPFKKGRPGWHLECSAMARKYLGDTIDIHCGGMDLKFPHHENEIAQAEGYTGQKFCNCWVHNGFVNVEDTKMSKSLGNFKTLLEACDNPLAVRSYRFLVVRSLYRRPLRFSAKALQGAQTSLKRIDMVMDQIHHLLEGKNIDYARHSVLATEEVPRALRTFESALLDDMGMPRATSSLFDLVKAAEHEFSKLSQNSSYSLDLLGLHAIWDAIKQMDKIFGILYEVPDSHLGSDQQVDAEIDSIPDTVLELVSRRNSARDAGDWDLADSLRERIQELGFSVADVKDGEPVVSRIS